MKLIAQVLTIYNWATICVLLLFLFGIAQFFERRLAEKVSGNQRRRYYPYLIIPVILFAVSALLYGLSEAQIVGNALADALRITGGIIFWYAGYSVFRTMLEPN